MQRYILLSREFSLGYGMKQVACDCGAQFTTQSEEELVEIVKLHGRMSHQMRIDAKQARGMIRDI